MPLLFTTHSVSIGPNEPVAIVRSQHLGLVASSQIPPNLHRTQTLPISDIISTLIVWSATLPKSDIIYDCEYVPIVPSREVGKLLPILPYPDPLPVSTRHHPTHHPTHQATHRVLQLKYILAWSLETTTSTLHTHTLSDNPPEPPWCE